MASATIHICSSAPSQRSRNPLSPLPTKDLFKSFKPLPTNLASTPSYPSNPCKLSCSWTPNSTTSPNNGSSTTSTATTLFPFGSSYNHWIVTMEKPGDGLSSKSDIIDYYVKTLSRVLGSEKEAQMCIYHASWESHFGFCCDIDEETSRQLAGLPGVLSVKPDTNFEYVKKDYVVATGTKPLGSSFDLLSHLSKFDKESPIKNSQLSSEVNSKYWLVRMEKPGVEVVTKPQMVDHYAQTLTKVFGNEKDAQMCIYHISWQNNFGFCCEIDEDVARELAGVPGVLSVQPDANFGSENKDYGGGQSLSDSREPGDANPAPNIKTKRLFVTGLSFYTSEKTLRAAFEGFGELVEVKIIMDKISKRSKGYGFIEYTTEEAASVALKEMNGKIINGWMIVVDVAKTSPPRYSREQRPGQTI